MTPAQITAREDHCWRQMRYVGRCNNPAVRDLLADHIRKGGFRSEDAVAMEWFKWYSIKQLVDQGVDPLYAFISCA